MTHRRSAPGPARRSRLLVLIAALSTVAGACGNSPESPAVSQSSAPSTSPSAAASPAASASSGPISSASADQVYTTIEGQVVDIRGLPRVDVKRQTIDEAALKTLSAQDFDADNPADYLAANDRLYRALGLIPADGDVRSYFLDLIGVSAQGFYRPQAKTLFVVSRTGQIDGNDRFTFSHEYDHALQDAAFTIFHDPERFRDQSDESMARAGLYEGDATLLMTQWAIANLDAAGTQDIIRAANDPDLAAVMTRTPQIITDNLTFPYQAGLMFVQAAFASGGWRAVDKLYADPPRSTEQVLHPEKYASGEEPVAVTIPPSLAKDLGAGWSVAFQDTFGEAQFATWLRAGGVAEAVAADAAAGWGGDRLAVVDGPAGAWAVVMDTVWDTPADAQAFQTAADTAVKQAGGEAGTFIGAGGTTRWVVIANDLKVFGRVANVLGLAG
jgi:hypothetical protein